VILRNRNAIAQMDALMLMLGDSGITDGISGTALAMVGTAATDTVLGVTAPKIGASWYTSGTIDYAPIGIVAGMDLTIMFAIRAAWAGDDGVAHYLMSGAGSPNRMNIYKSSTNRLYVEMDTAVASPVGAITALNWPANETNIIIVTRSGANVNAYLNGTNIASSTGNTPETALHAHIHFGTNSALAVPLEGAFLAAIWGRVLV
jgi:hypothetical protein